ncbi:MAG: GC-type dockerin domain-anchored protein [Planctomycetota bacterium]
MNNGFCFLVAATALGVAQSPAAQTCDPMVIGPVVSADPNAFAASSDGTLAAVVSPGGVLLLDFETEPPAETFVPFTERADWVEVSGDSVYVVTNQTFVVLDASDRTAPVEIGSVSDPRFAGIWAGGQASPGGRVLLCDLTAGVLWVDASDPTAPIVAAEASVPVPHSVDVAGDFAFVSQNGIFRTMTVLDVSSPAAFAEIASVDLPGASASDGIAIAGDAAIIGVGNNLAVVDISTPTAPQFVQLVEVLPRVTLESVIVSGDRGFVVGFDFPVPSEVPLVVFDLSDPLAPAEIGRTTVNGAVSRSTLVGSTLIVPSTDSQTTLVDVSSCLVEQCTPDTNGDGDLTPADFNAWILAFNAQAAACDQNGDGACTPGDFNGWVLNFNAGC